MSKRSIQIKLNESSFNELTELSEHPDQAVARRAKVILACAEGNPTNQQVSQITGMNPADISHWRKQYSEHGIEGLRSHHGGGKQPAKTVSDINKKITELLSDKTKEWTVELLASATGATRATVSGTLRRLGVTLSRTRWWNIQTTDELISKTVDICGLYISKNEQAIIVSCSEKSIGALFGRLSTRIRVLSEDFNASNEPISLATAIQTAVWRAKEISGQNPIRIWDYLSDTLDYLPDADDAEYHVFVCSPENVRYTGTKLRGVYFHTVDTTDAWLSQVEQWFEGMCDRHQPKAAETLLNAIRNYIDNAIPESDPILWDKKEKEESPQTAQSRPVTPASESPEPEAERLTISPELTAELSELLKRILPMQELKSDGIGCCCIPVIFDHGEIKFDVIEDHKRLPAADHYDFQNMRGIQKGIGEAEPVIISVRDRAGVRSIEMLMDLVKKKPI